MGQRLITLESIAGLRNRIARGERDIGTMAEVDGILETLQHDLTPAPEVMEEAEEEEVEVEEDHDGDPETAPVKTKKKKGRK